MQSISFSPLEIQATREYWTAERIANATPAPFLGIKMPEERQQKYDEFSQAETEICFCAANDESECIANIKLAPFKKAGRLYYVTANGQPLYATAQFVENNILMTAAHCLKNEFSGRQNSGWSTNMLFQRAYPHGHLVHDIVVGSINVPSEWGFGNGFNMIKYNYGFMKTVDISDVGFLDFPKKCKLPTEMTAIGYTNNHGNNQEFMYKIQGKKGKSEDGAIAIIGNDMDYGAVGGAWFTGKANYNSNIIYGLNTWRESGTIYGPLFNWRVLNDINALRNETLYKEQNATLSYLQNEDLLAVRNQALLDTVQNQYLPQLGSDDVDDFFASLQ